MILLFCGLSGAGKTTLAKGVTASLAAYGINTEIIDGDEYRAALCKDLGFTREDRAENIRRLCFVASRLSAQGIVAIVSAINPYDDIRQELLQKYNHVNIVHIDCPVDKLIIRDTKGLYKRALLPEGHPDKLSNLTGINDQFDIPVNPHLYINTNDNTIEESKKILTDHIVNGLQSINNQLNKIVTYT